VSIIKQNSAFFIPYLIFLVISSIALMVYGKADTHLYLNGIHSTALDVFFKYYTHTGNGIFATCFTLALCFVKFRYAIISAVSTTLSGIIVQILKILVFKDALRPVLYFKTLYGKMVQIHTVSGATPGNLYSFPSGHSATAFAVFLLLAIIIGKPWLKFVLFILAFFSAFSRVYLSWHFLGDTMVGSLIGVTITLMFYTILSKSKKAWLDKSIF
jgi:membrane-associated phospholipid phosphatase